MTYHPSAIRNQFRGVESVQQYRVQILDLTDTVADQTQYAGGFTDGTYGYAIPGGPEDGIVVRFDINDFSTTSTLDLTSTNANLTGFSGGFTDGRYGYLVPRINDETNSTPHGNVARIDLTDFSTVASLNLTNTDSDLAGFIGGCCHGNYAYFVPWNNGDYFGKVARVDITDFSTVTVLDLTSVDSNLQGFIDGYVIENYLYLCPSTNTSGGHGNLTRIDLDDFTTSGVEVLNLAELDSGLVTYHGGFTDGIYAYLRPASNGDAVRVRHSDFTLESVETLTMGGGTRCGFTDGRYGYYLPAGSDMRVVDLSKFDEFITVSYDNTAAGLGGTFMGGFYHRGFGYCIPYESVAAGRVVKFPTFYQGAI